MGIRLDQARPEGDSYAPTAIVLSGYGLNCDLETEFALRNVGWNVNRIHINELIGHPELLSQARLLALVGGFSWADDHGAGVVLAVKLRRHLGERLFEFVERGGFVIGICNGFQALVNLGMLPALGPRRFERQVALAWNDCGNFRDQWVRVRLEAVPCVFTQRMPRWLLERGWVDLPVRHAEGKVVAETKVLEALEAERRVVLRYAAPDGTPAGGRFPWNPNGSMNDIAGLCDGSGRVMGLMPHPEAFHHPSNHPLWHYWKAGCRQGSVRSGAESADGGSTIGGDINSAQASGEGFLHGSDAADPSLWGDGLWFFHSALLAAQSAEAAKVP